MPLIGNKKRESQVVPIHLRLSTEPSRVGPNEELPWFPVPQLDLLVIAHHHHGCSTGPVLSNSIEGLCSAIQDIRQEYWALETSPKYTSSIDESSGD